MHTASAVRAGDQFPERRRAVVGNRRQVLVRRQRQRLAATALAMEVRADRGQPGEEMRSLLLRDSIHGPFQRPHVEVVGLRRVAAAEPQGDGIQRRALFGHEPPRSRFRVGPYVFRDVHSNGMERHGLSLSL